MVSFADIKSEINTQWGLAPGQANPTIYDKDIRYSTLYTDRLYIKTYNEMPLKEVSLNSEVVLRKQIFSITGVYATYALAKTAIQEIKSIVVDKADWYIANKEMTVIQTSKRYIFTLECYERKSLLKGDW